MSEPTLDTDTFGASPAADWVPTDDYPYHPVDRARITQALADKHRQAPTPKVPAAAATAAPHERPAPAEHERHGQAPEHVHEALRPAARAEPAARSRIVSGHDMTSSAAAERKPAAARPTRPRRPPKGKP